MLRDLLLAGGCVVLVVSVSFTGCGTSASSLCDAYCDCEGCSDRDLDDCIDDVEDAERDAEREGCEDEFDDYADCIDGELECRNGHVDADGCENEAEDLSDCMSDTRSGGGVQFGDPCQRVYQKLESCGFQTQGDQQSCPAGAGPCIDCLVDRSCAEIRDGTWVNICADACGTAQ
jgi:hypothetical protein